MRPPGPRRVQCVTARPSGKIPKVAGRGGDKRGIRRMNYLHKITKPRGVVFSRGDKKFSFFVQRRFCADARAKSDCMGQCIP